MAKFKFLYIINIWLLVISLQCYSFENKYSADYATVGSQEKPFRIHKLNVVWEKASWRLPKEKLKSLFTDLKFQDKEELAYKKIKAEGLDKNGLKEAVVRGSFKAILERYGLAADFAPVPDAAAPPYRDPLTDNVYNPHFKRVFRDKKLNNLWMKAEKQGFSGEQLQTLLEEFQHHQNKIDQYYNIMDSINKASFEKDYPFNSIDHILYAEEGEKPYKGPDNPYQMLKDKHGELKAGYDHLHKKVLPYMAGQEFEEPAVNTLWEMARNSSFTPIELESLKSELHHFEHRIRKLKNLSEMEYGGYYGSSSYDEAKRQKKLKEYNYKVEKYHRELTNRILERSHTEL